MSETSNWRAAAWVAGGVASAGALALLLRWRSAHPLAHRRAVLVRVPAQRGDRVADIETPALVVDLDRARANMALLSTQLAAFPNVTARIHAKSHKCPALAKLQLSYPRTRGVCCAKGDEAIAMMEEGVTDVLISNEIVDERKIRRVVAAAARADATLAVCVDQLQNARAWAEAAAEEAGVRVRMLVELNVGQNRCGVQTPEQAAELAQAIASLSSVEFAGIQAYNGAAQHIRDPHERGAAVQQVVAKAQATVALLRARGLECQVVTGGGTGSYPFEAGSGLFTEIQPGSYVFNDADYSRNPDNAWRHSLLLLCTVISRNEEGGWVVVDAGLKASSVDSGLPELEGMRGEVRVENQGDEHLKLVYPPSLRHAMPAVGAMLRLVPGHCDPTVNMHEWLVAVVGDEVHDVWRVHRGPGL